MHLFVVSPALDRLWHLHPREIATGAVRARLPDLPAGQYELFADLVHATGVSETVTATARDRRRLQGAPLTGDDSAWAADATPSRRRTHRLGARRQPLVAKRLTCSRFESRMATGSRRSDLELYMGMPGHAVFVRRDRQRVRARASVGLGADGGDEHRDAVGHVDTRSTTTAPPSTVSFPYGFPEPGAVPDFVQVKRAGRGHHRARSTPT